MSDKLALILPIFMFLIVPIGATLLLASRHILKGVWQAWLYAHDKPTQDSCRAIAARFGWFVKKDTSHPRALIISGEFRSREVMLAVNPEEQTAQLRIEIASGLDIRVTSRGEKETPEQSEAYPTGDQAFDRMFAVHTPGSLKALSFEARTALTRCTRALETSYIVVGHDAHGRHLTITIPISPSLKPATIEDMLVLQTTVINVLEQHHINVLEQHHINAKEGRVVQ